MVDVAGQNVVPPLIPVPQDERPRRWDTKDAGRLLAKVVVVAMLIGF